LNVLFELRAPTLAALVGRERGTEGRRLPLATLATEETLRHLAPHHLRGERRREAREERCKGRREGKRDGGERRRRETENEMEGGRSVQAGEGVEEQRKEREMIGRPFNG